MTGASLIDAKPGAQPRRNSGQLRRSATSLGMQRANILRLRRASPCGSLALAVAPLSSRRQGRRPQLL